MKVFLHIGAPKTGTSFVQAVLMHNRELLADQGIFFPAGSWGEGHVWPVVDLMRRGGKGALVAKARGSWDVFVADVLAHDGPTALLSMEFLATALPEHVAKIKADLPGAELHVVLTARDLARQYPATWQESVQNGQSWTWNRFLTACRDEPDSPPARYFRRHQDLAQMARIWGEQVPADRIHLVTVPRSGPPTELWRRFCQVVGIDPQAFDLEVTRSNRSLGAASAEVMRLVNKYQGGMDHPTAMVVKHRLAKTVLADREGESKITVPYRFRPWIVETSKAMVSELHGLGLQVVGDLDDLVADFEGTERLPKPTDREVLEAAVDGLVGLTREIAELRQALEAAGRPTEPHPTD